MDLNLLLVTLDLMSEGPNSKVVPFEWKVSMTWYRNICLCLCVSGVEARRLCAVQRLRAQRPRHAEVQSRQQAGAELLCPARRHPVLLLLQRSGSIIADGRVIHSQVQCIPQTKN